MKHIDSHIHLYPEKLMNAIYGYFQRLGWNLPFCSGVEETLLHLEQHDVEKAFLLLYAHKAGMSWDLNQWAYQLCQQKPHLYPFGCFYPEDHNPEVLVKKCLKDWDFAGFKLHFNVQRSDPDDPRYLPVYRGALEYGKGIVMHVGTFPNTDSCSHSQAKRLQSVLQRFPTLNVIVAHMGCYQTEYFWRIMDRYPGVYLDTSFILGNPQFPDGHQLVFQSLKRFPHRILYGSDFPLICHHLQGGLDYISQLPWTDQQKRDLLRENALRFLAQTNVAAERRGIV